MFLNLVGNALDAVAASHADNPPEESFVRVSCNYEEETGVVATVADNGKGMSPEVLKHIFEPFYSTKADKGTGLGMFITYGIVRRLGGEIHVESEEGRGSVVRVILPLVPPEVPVEV